MLRIVVLQKDEKADPFNLSKSGLAQLLDPERFLPHDEIDLAVVLTFPLQRQSAKSSPKEFLILLEDCQNHV